MNIQLKNKSLQATQILRDTTNHEDFWELAKHFSCKRFGDKIGGFQLRNSDGEGIMAFYGEWVFWSPDGIVDTLSDELFRKIFEVAQ